MHILTHAPNSDNNHVQLDYANDLDAIVAAEYEMDKSLYTYEAIGVTDYSILDKTIRYVNAEYPGSDKLDCNRKYAPNTALCMLAPAKFYESFTEYLATSAGLIYGDQIAWTDASKSEIKALKIPFVLYNARSYDDKMDALRETRYATDSNKALGAYPQGSFYTFYEQFVNVEKYMVQSLLMCAAVVTIVCFGFLFHPMAVLLVVLSIGVTVVEVLGFLSLAGLKANGPSAMNMILAVGLCIEFNVHLARHFITASGTRRERAVVAVTEMGGPVFLGGISTFLGVCFLSGAEFPYFVLYFFNMYAIIIFIGMMNGLLLLPVLLSLVGPDAILDNAEGAAAKDNEEEEANKNQA